jgi:hypothetical protein
MTMIGFTFSRRECFAAGREIHPGRRVAPGGSPLRCL